MSHSSHVQSWRTSGGTLASVYIRVPKQLLVMKCPSNRINGLARGSAANRQKAESPSFMSLYVACHQRPSIGVSIPASKKSDKKNPPRELPKAWVLADSRCSQVDIRD